MIYKDFQNLKLSALGMGTMRLPLMEGDYAAIDVAQTEKMIAYAIEHGVNYFDTAWGYHDGQSEIIVGNALKKYPRDSYFIADKFPGYDLSNMDSVQSIFEEQLKKCGVSYFDFYLFHNVCESNIDEYLNEKHGILAYLLEQKASGRIRHLGFSVHGSYDVTKRFLNYCGSYMEFGQIQLNYLDWTLQDAKSKIELLGEYNIPVWVMEPLRGGKLASLSEENAAVLKELRPDESITAWAFRFLQSIPSVKMVLSGMSNQSQLEQNIKTFESEKPLTEHEMKALMEIADNMLKQKTLPCTECRYCVSHCPQQLDIPNLISLYNEHRFSEGGFLAPMVISSLAEEKRPSACISCKSCEAVCPQQLVISEAMSDFAKLLKS